MSTILLVDDEPNVRSGQRSVLEIHGFSDVQEAGSLAEARAILSAHDVAVVLLDLMLNGESGRDFLGEIVAQYPRVPVIVVTGVAEVDVAVACMREGAYDFLVKGRDTKRIASAVHNAVETARRARENRVLRRALHARKPARPEVFSGFLTASSELQRSLAIAEALSELDDPILVLGETGVGKELIARGIHVASGLPGEFVPVNMGGLDDHMFADTLFGHTRGAFTGATTSREGLVTRAGSGTLFLDEIGEMPVESQARLLRLLDSGEFMRLGSDRREFSQARIVCATNRNLEKAVEEDRFRRDLYYRISLHAVRIPPLRERPEDIAPLLTHLVALHAERMGCEPLTVSHSVVKWLRTKPLLGNVRELEQIVVRSLVVGEWGESAYDSARPPGAALAADVRFGDTLPTPEALVQALYTEALTRHGGNRPAAAASIGLSPQAFANRLRRLSRRTTDSVGDAH